MEKICKFSLVQLAADGDSKDSNLADVRRYCPSMQTDFWNCMNKTLTAVQRGAQWSGRICCPLATHPKCQNACATSASREELITGCRQSDEQNLFSCFDRQDVGDECCGNARTSKCLQACRDIFRSRLSPVKEQRNLVESVCNDNNTNSKVLQCVQNFFDLTPLNNSKQYLPCCDHAPNLGCKNVCTNILTVGETTQEMIDDLERGGCGPVVPYDPLWQCFLSAGRKVSIPVSDDSVSQINQVGMDSAKLHCCHKAFSPKCRRLCIQTFSNDWTETRVDFEFDCYSQISEMSLKQCLDEGKLNMNGREGHCSNEMLLVDEPCELGCDGLSFCTNFNNRPTELFRSCNNQADNAAREDVALWKQNSTLSLPGLTLPIKDISQCSPETWKAIICSLQIKPCTRQKHANQICREDCYEILSKCMDWTRLEAGHTASSICSRLSLEDSTAPCVSIKPYIEPSDLPHHTGNHKIISPCLAHPCNATEVCQLKRDGGIGYECVPGCALGKVRSQTNTERFANYFDRIFNFLGETSTYMVPLNSYVRIPVSLKQKGCLKICKCGLSGRIEHCQPLPCVVYDSCMLAGKKIEHASWFHVECNICSCFAGEITCTKKQCKMPGISDKSFTSLPCNCPPHYVPVCARNGMTYSSACVARCTGIPDTGIEFGPCSKKSSCEDVACPGKGICVERRQVCLSVMHRPCQQFECINVTSNCPIPFAEEACSTDGRTFPSFCNLIKAKSQLAYKGPCLRHCNYHTKEKMCGINGITYKSECDAWSDFALIDYIGECREVGLLTDSMGPRCATVKCKSLPSKHCEAIVPPGACCPVCSASLRIVYSRKQIDRALYALKGKNTEALTLRAILRGLSGLIRISHCRLFGFLTMETDLFVTVQSLHKEPSYIQIEACVRESEKIATLISSQSHRITSDLALSSLTVANIMTQFNSAGVSSNSDLTLGNMKPTRQFNSASAMSMNLLCSYIGLVGLVSLVGRFI
ncbi:hypothetical protein HA402_004723 [Bradysia odoriphaga]|nr:hypothetical protein HA402_004723 [Bradysia odoriphaga]